MPVKSLTSTTLVNVSPKCTEIWNQSSVGYGLLCFRSLVSWPAAWGFWGEHGRVAHVVNLNATVSAPATLPLIDSSKPSSVAPPGAHCASEMRFDLPSLVASIPDSISRDLSYAAPGGVRFGGWTTSSCCADAMSPAKSMPLAHNGER